MFCQSMQSERKIMYQFIAMFFHDSNNFLAFIWLLILIVALLWFLVLIVVLEE